MGRGGANSDVGQLIIVFAVGYLALTGGLTGIGEWINGLIPPPPPVNPPPEPPSGAKSLYDAIRNGGSVTLSGEYYIDRQITVSRGLSLTGSAEITSTADFSGYALIIQGTSSAPIAVSIGPGVSFNFAERTAGIKIQYADGVNLRCKVENTVKRGPRTYVDGIDVKNSRNILADGLTVNNIQFSGICFSNCADITVRNGRFHNNAQLYPGGASIQCDVGCSNIYIGYNTITGDSMNDGIYCGQSGSPATGSILIERNNININSQPGGTFMGDAIKTYAVNAVVQYNSVDMTRYAFGISDWGTGTIIRYNTVTDCYTGIKSPNTLIGNTVSNCYAHLYEYY